MADSPLVSFVTMTRWGAVYPRIARWLGSGFRQIGVNADIVFIEGPPGLVVEGAVREVRLGVRRARWAIPALRRYLGERQPSMTLASPGTIGSLAVLAGRRERRAVVPWESTIPRLDSADLPLYVRPYRTLCTMVYQSATRVAAVSGGVRDALVEDLAGRLPPERIVVIPNPVDAHEIHRLSLPLTGRTSRLRLCSVGRLVSAKGFDVLIEALALVRLGGNWELLIVGDGPLRADLERLVRRRRLEEHVRFIRAVRNPYPIMASADIAVQASRWEGFGMVILEALALGIPLISTDCPGGVGETLDRGRYGVLVPPDDAAAMADALGQLADDVELRRTLTQQGPVRAAEYAPARVAEIIARLAADLGNETLVAELGTSK